MRCCCTTIRMNTIKNNYNFIKCWEVCRVTSTPELPLEYVIIKIIWGNCMSVSTRTEHIPTHDLAVSPLGLFPGELSLYVHQKTYTGNYEQLYS